MAHVRIHAQDNALFGRRETIATAVRQAAADAFGGEPAAVGVLFAGHSPDDAYRPAGTSDDHTRVVLHTTPQSSEAKQRFAAAVRHGYAERYGVLDVDVEVLVIELPEQDWL